ncbi:hypothetical protein [Ectothiorhodospira lacustris]|uniref:hypothetical protein n=1 Tax=Ectothiorhodospira lacustris TaxID=2899127 RepID=UPI001EE95C8A|nr:hypothetical protein [Ectothiorhodospira lacustris]MCG5501470.1 hypothetical protein [Ectothiorhodospira lacustris]
MNDKEAVILTTQEAEKYLERAMPALKELIVSTREFHNEDNIKDVGEAVEGLGWLSQYSHSMQHLVASGYPEMAGHFAQFEKDISFIISQMVEGSRNQDQVLIADIMEYEVMPLFEAMKEIIGQVLHKIRHH